MDRQEVSRKKCQVKGKHANDENDRGSAGYADGAAYKPSRVSCAWQGEDRMHVS